MRKTAITLTIAGLFLITALVPASMADAAPVYSKYAIIVGCWDDGSAAGGDYGLAGPEFDVRDVGGYLRSIGYETTELVCAGATPAAIRAAFADVVEKCDADDSFVFYYTGHGSWLLESEIDLYDGRFTESDFKAALEGIKTNNVFMSFDCCQAGGFSGWNLGPHHYSVPLFEGLAKEGWIAVSASSIVFSYDGEIGGVFTDLFWREGLIEGKANEDYFAGMLGGTGDDARTSVEEAYYYARTAMNIKNQASTPMMDDQCDGEWFL